MSFGVKMEVLVLNEGVRESLTKKTFKQRFGGGKEASLWGQGRKACGSGGSKCKGPEVKHPWPAQGIWGGSGAGWEMRSGRSPGPMVLDIAAIGVRALPERVEVIGGLRRGVIWCELPFKGSLVC
jgi:hypothetical protein